MNKKITLLFTLLAFALSSSAQISFNINEYEDLNLDYERFDFDKKYVVTNNAENADKMVGTILCAVAWYAYLIQKESMSIRYL